MKKLILITEILLMAAFVQAQNWETDLSVAREKASTEGRNILLVFSGSDWCIPCMKLEREIWQSEEFKKDAAGHFVLLRADFPKKKANRLGDEQQKRNEQLAETYNKQGIFPLVAVLDKEGKLLGTTGYKNIPPREYVALLHSIEK